MDIEGYKAYPNVAPDRYVNWTIIYANLINT
jgi:hypothetical protein